MKIKLTQEIVRELLDYDPETGLLHWKERDVKWFRDNAKWSAENCCKAWNAKYAKTQAFTSINTHGYNQGNIFKKLYRAHQIIWFWMTGRWCELIDHDNRDKTDNRWCNLKESNKLQNGRNQKMNSLNTSGCMGVYYDKRRDNWYVKISRTYIASGLSYEDAVSVRKQAESKYGYHENHGN